MKRALVISPHPDDAEFGCGATLSSLAKNGVEIIHVLVTPSENMGYKIIDREIKLREFREANDVLGIKKLHICNEFKHRYLSEQRQELLQFFVDIREEYNPDAVFIPGLDDTHQDHAAVAIEGFRAFKNCDILGYDILWNNISFKSQAFYILEENDLNIKINALMRYETQRARLYLDAELIRGAARVRGAQAGVKYAEAFSNMRRFINWEL